MFWQEIQPEPEEHMFLIAFRVQVSVGQFVCDLLSMAPKLSKPLVETSDVEGAFGGGSSSAGYVAEVIAPPNPSSASETSSDGSDAESEDEDEKSPKSDDGQESNSDGDDQGQDPSGASSVDVSKSVAVGVDAKEIAENAIDPAFIDEHILTMISSALTKDEIENALNETKAKASFYVKMFMEAKEKMKKAKSDQKKEAKKQIALDERERVICVNVLLPTSKTIQVNLANSSTVAELRNKASESIVGMSKKDKKKLMLEFHSVYIHDRPRKTIQKMGLFDGCIVSLKFGGSGGGKMAKEDKVVIYKARAENSYNQIPPFVVDSNITATSDAKFKEMMANTDENYIYDTLNGKTLDELEEALEIISDFKLYEPNLHRLAPIFLTEAKKVDDIVKNLSCASKTLELAWCYAFTVCYFDSTSGRYDFSSFSSALVELIKEKKMERDLKEKHGLMSS